MNLGLTKRDHNLLMMAMTNNRSAALSERKRRFSYHLPSTRLGWLRTPGPTALDPSPPVLVPGSTRILVACMPKSASTFLTTAIAGLPGLRRTSLYPAPVNRREQEFDLLRLLQEEAITAQICRNSYDLSLMSNLGNMLRGGKTIAKALGGEGWVAQQHVRFSSVTACLIKDYRIVPVFLVRNIFDALISMRDHLRDNAVNMAMAHFTPQMHNLSDEQMADFLVDMVAPWYINFFVSWQDCPDRVQVDFEQIRKDPVQCILSIMSTTDLKYSDKEVATAIENAKKKKVRMNKGVSGRGAAFDYAHKSRIRRYAEYYPFVDFAPIGIDR